MDTQSLKKHHFWILLTLAVVLVPVILGGAFFGVRGAVAKREEALKQKKQKLTSASPKGQNYITELDSQKSDLDGRRRDVWQRAYEAQAAQGGLFRWPEELRKYDEAYFGDPVPDPDREKFRNVNVYYGELYEPLKDIIAPTFFTNRTWYGVLRYVPDWKNPPTNEEIWLALEDVAVQREILRDIHSVNQMLAEFLPLPNPADYEPGPEIAPENRAQEKKKLEAELKAEQAKVTKELRDYFKAGDRAAVGRFLSPYWQLDLAVDKLNTAGARADDLEVKYRLKNVSPKRQDISSIDFKLFLNRPRESGNDPFATLNVQSQFLASQAVLPSSKPYETVAIKSKGGTEPTMKIYKVEQKLRRKDVPVKEVERLELGYVGHRFANRALVATAFSQKEMETAQADAPPAGAPPGGPPPGPPGGRGDMGGGPGGMSGRADPNFTPMGVPRLRYLDRTDQVRRMPVGVTLVVDQAHVQDVLRAFANSRLRFQGTQFHWQRYHGGYDPTEPDETGATGLDPTQPGSLNPPGGGPAGGFRRGLPGGGGDMGGGENRRGPPIGSGFGGGQPPRGGGFGRGFGPGFERGRGGLPGTLPPGSLSGQGYGVIQTTSEEGGSNLVELSIYGLVSLYERFPPKAPAGGDATAAPGGAPTPAPGGAAPAGGPPPPPPGALPVPPPAGPGGGKP
jgi:hypothetical protein